MNAGTPEVAESDCGQFDGDVGDFNAHEYGAKASGDYDVRDYGNYNPEDDVFFDGDVTVASGRSTEY